MYWHNVGRVAQSVQRLSYGLDGPGIEFQWGARFSAPVQTGPGAHTASCTIGTGSFPRVKSGWGVILTPHPLLVPWSWRGRAIPLLPLWAVRPVQSLSACKEVTFTLPQCLYKGDLYLLIDTKYLLVISLQHLFETSLSLISIYLITPLVFAYTCHFFM